GRDTINGGAGNDAIIVVGTTTAGQYNNADITNPAGSGQNLSDLITLADLNGRTVSEVVAGEVINGGSGTNTLYIYGTVDLTGVTLSNVTVLIVSSDVTLSADQMALFSTVDGDGTSTINIEVPPGDTYIIDLSTLNLTDVGSLNVEGNVTFIVDDASDFSEIGSISTQNSADVSVEINGSGAETIVNLGNIADKINNVDSIEVADEVTLEIDNADDINNLGLSEIKGGGEIDIDGNADVQQALDDTVEIVIIRNGTDNFSTEEDTPIVISFDDLLANDTSATPGGLTVINVELLTASEDNGSVSINHGLGTVTVTPGQDFNGWLSLSYTVANNDGNTAEGTLNVRVDAVDDLPTGWGSVAIGGLTMTHDAAFIIGDTLLNYYGEQMLISDVDSPDGSIYIRVEDIDDGTITRDGVPVTEFTYTDLLNWRIEFLDQGDNPTLILSFSNDGVNYGNATTIEITDTLNGDVVNITQGGDFGSNYTIPHDNIFLLGGSDRFFYSDSVTSTFVNNGHMEGYGSGWVTPIFVDNVGTITNNGYIDSDGYSDNSTAVYVIQTGQVLNNGLISSVTRWTSEDIASGVRSPELINSGTIFSVGGNANGAMFIGDIDVLNTGTIYAEGNISAFGILNSEGTATIVNSGNIIAVDNNDALDSVAINLSLSGGFVTNTGYISGETAIFSSYSLYMNNSGEIHGDIETSIFTDDIINTGNIFGNVELNDSADSFNNTGGQVFGVIDGGAGNDLLTGGSFTDYLNGGEGDDYLTTGTGGSDRLAGGTGDDVFGVGHLSFKKISGGSGNDVIILTSDGTILDFDSFDVTKITDIEEIFLGAVGVTLDIDAAHIIAITDANNTLRVGGNGNDLLTSDDTWTRGDDQVINTVTYRSYTSGDATLLVEEDVDFTANRIEPTPSLTINDVAVNEADGTATFIVTLSYSISDTVTVDYVSPDGSSGTLTFNPNVKVQTFETTWVDDDIFEEDEISFATLSNPTNATLLDNTGQLTIVNDEPATIVAIGNAAAVEDVQFATFTVSLNQVSNVVLTVDYAAPDGSTGTLTFNPGETEKTFQTVWTDDNIDEPTEIAFASLSNPSLGLEIGDPTGQLTIIDDDLPFPSITIGDTVRSEATGYDYVVVTLSQAYDDTVTVDYTSPLGDGTVTFQAGTTVKSIQLTWDDDYIDENDEIIPITLLNPVNATIADNTGLLTILDNDEPPVISINDIAVNEADQTAQFTVSLSAQSDNVITVEYLAPDGSSGTLTFNPGDTGKTFSSVWIDDATEEADEILIATLSNPTNASIGDSTGQLIIVDDDAVTNSAPVAADDAIVSEENLQLTIDVLANDVDADGDALTLTNVVVGASQGTASIVGNEINFDPGTDFDYLDTNETADVTITYTVSDGAQSDEGTLTLTLYGENDAPVTNDNSVSIDSNDILIFDAFANDYDAEGHDFAVGSLSYPSILGDLSFNEYFKLTTEGNFDHLADGESVEHTLFYDVGSYHDGRRNESNRSDITITINGTNEDPDHNTVVFVGQDMIFDFSRLGNIDNPPVENVDITGSGDNTVVLTAAEVLQFTDNNNILTILGDTGDSVESAGEGWVQGADQLIDTDTYSTYTAGGATLLIDADITQDIS
ncbi:MAG: cadherin-like domain-containing protein, partial [Emcibacteraceae bacterium]|nr:cadherin-like domain-containing protein [Emcibacteraceae bacterium]